MGTTFDRLITRGGYCRARVTLQGGLFTLLADTSCIVTGTARRWSKAPGGKFGIWQFTPGSLQTSEIPYSPWRHPSEVPPGDGLTVRIGERVWGAPEYAWIDLDTSGPMAPLDTSISETRPDVFVLQSNTWIATLTLGRIFTPVN